MYELILTGNFYIIKEGKKTNGNNHEPIEPMTFRDISKIINETINHKAYKNNDADKNDAVSD